MITLWARILQALPGSRMLVLSGTGTAGDERIRAGFRAGGIDPERLTLLERQPPAAYFRLYHRVDLCLDTFPYNGQTTTADALWMGVPVVTLAGATWINRQAMMPLGQAGLADLVADTASGHVEKAVRLAGDLPTLRRLRPQLRPRLRHAPFTDIARFTRELEAAYRTMVASARAP